MKKILMMFCILLCNVSNALAIEVFTCEPEWKSLVEEIAKDKVEVYSATNAFQDVHYIQAKPSLIAKIRKADMVVCSGSDLEVGWLPLILRKAGNSLIQEGGNNLVYASNYVQTIEKPQRIDRVDGDVHPNGNPHIHLNPYNILKVAKVVSDRIAEIYNENSDFYKNNYKVFSDKMIKKIKEWEKSASGLKGKNVIANHKNMSYLFDWLKINTVGTLEPKPGIPATSKHLSNLVNVVEQKKVDIVVMAPFERLKPAEWLAEKSGTKTIVLPYTIGGNDEVKNLFDLYENSIKLLLQR